MYTREDKERILADLRDSGMSVAAFSKLPGSPCRHSLSKWLAEAGRGELDVPGRRVTGRCEHRKHARYPEETKREAVRLVRKGMRPHHVARRLGVSSGGVVSGWARAADARERERAAREEEGPGGPGGCSIDPEAVEMEGPEASARIEELEAELADARLRLAALEEMVADPKSGDPASLSNAQKSELGERLRRDYGYRLRDVLESLRISKSSYEYAKGAARRRRERDEAVRARVREAFDSSGGTYGYRRVWAAVRSGADGGEPMEVSQREVRRAMREGGMRARRTRRRPWSSYAGETDERPANVPLERRGRGAGRFVEDRPWAMAVTDVTEMAVGGSKVYLSPVIDCFDGLPVSWSVSRRPDSELVGSSLEAFLERAPEGAVVHTDGGGTYRSRRWKEACAGHGAVRSMSRKSCCGDNARAEGFFGRLKEEFYNGRDWSRCPPERFEEELDAYIRWYRDGRLKLFEEEDGTKHYETIMGRRRRLGYAA